MPDKKLTDNEIIKALECCVLAKHICPHDCPMLKNKECLESLRKNALDLINRLQAENERLRAVKKHIDILIHRGIEYPTTESYNEAFQKALARLYDNTKAKAEAYKEYAEKLENRILSMLNTATLEEKEIICACIGTNNNLLKEMGESNES